MKTLNHQEEEQTYENKNDVFKCLECGKKTTRENIHKIWKVIPFCDEDKKTYYCGCRGWE